MTIKRTNSEKIFSWLKKIPQGKIITYKGLAKLCRMKNGFRVIGNVLSKNKDLKNIPCYKVIKSDGSIGGYVLGKAEKERFLEKEGLKIKNNKVIDFQKNLFKIDKKHLS